MLEFLKAFDPTEIPGFSTLHTNQLGNHINFLGKNQDLDAFHIAILGVEDARGSIENEDCDKGPNVVRKFLYQLYLPCEQIQVIDLGNIKAGATFTDTLFAVKEVVELCLSKRVIPIILGGCHPITYGQYHAYEKSGEMINCMVLDERLNIRPDIEGIDHDNHVLRILAHEPNYLFNFSHLGHQIYYNDLNTLNTLDKLNFDSFRLGDLREDISLVEPLIRDADMLSFDIAAIRYSDAPGTANASPNGFFGEQACRIARYAGISDKLSSFGIYEYNPVLDINQQTAQLISQMMWYFIEGFYSRKHDFPAVRHEDFTKYIVNQEDNQYEMIFWKSKRSDRWWIQLPMKKGQKAPNKIARFQRHQLIPCSYHDYEAALAEEIPEVWLRAISRTSSLALL